MIELASQQQVSEEQLKIIDDCGDDLKSHLKEPDHGRDSGIESGVDSEADLVRPDAESMEKMVKQLEYYFTDEYLIKDQFLVKHIRRNREGFVSLKLLASFRKMKTLTKDWKEVAYAVKKCSKTLEINDSCTKLRRIEPFKPTTDGNGQSARTVVVLGLAKDLDNHDAVANIFNRNEDIVLIRIFRPDGQAQNLSNSLQSLVKSRPLLARKSLATVEMTTKAAAEEAVRGLNQASNWRQPFEVALLKSAEESQKTQSNGNLYTPRSGQDNTRFFQRQRSRTFGFDLNRQPAPLAPVNRSVKVIRCPKGPDGTSGFHQNKFRSNSH